MPRNTTPCGNLRQMDTPLDLNTALASIVGPISGVSVWAIDFAPDGRLFGAFFSLYLLNRNTGQVISKVGDLSEDFSNYVVDIDFASDGSIYGVNYYSRTLSRIHPNTGISAVLGTYQSALWGLASQGGTSSEAPSITTQPQSQTVIGNANVSFSVTASGAATLSYQWRKDSVNVPAATNSTLILTNVSRASGGAYSVTVSNNIGSVISSNAMLRVRVPQRFAQSPQRLSAGQIRLLFGDWDGGLLSANDATNLVVQATTNFVNWVMLTNSFTITNGRVQVDDAESPNLPRRFYRVIEP